MQERSCSIRKREKPTCSLESKKKQLFHQGRFKKDLTLTVEKMSVIVIWYYNQYSFDMEAKYQSLSMRELYLDHLSQSWCSVVMD